MTPPHFLILSFSSSLSGVWYFVSVFASTNPFAPLDTSMQRLSPTLATCNEPFVTYRIVAVVPEEVELMLQFDEMISFAV